MKTLFSLLLVTLFSACVFASDCATAPRTDSTKISIKRNGHESKIDSIVYHENETLIYIDGIKSPVNNSSVTTTNQSPSQRTPNHKKNEKASVDTSKSAHANPLHKANNSLVLIALIFLGLIGIVLFTIGVLGIVSKKKSGKDKSFIRDNGEKNNASDFSSSRTTPVLLREDNRMTLSPVVDVDYAPAYSKMPTRQQLIPAALPSMIITAYANQPHFLRQYGVIAEVKNIRHGYLNGEFMMQHADGSISRQKFTNEPGFRAKVTLKNGDSMYIYSRYSCLNDVRGVQLTEVLNQPTFTQESSVKSSKNATTTTIYNPENVAA